MSSTIFNEIDHKLSVVKRWGTVHTIQTQSVAEHIFNVERMAVRIAKRWFGIKSIEILHDVMEWAHHHEDLESISGDLPTMVKPYFDEDAMQREHSDIVSYPESYSPLVYKIVKLADKLEGYHFLCVEFQLGNAYTDHHFDGEPAIIAQWIAANWEEEEAIRIWGLMDTEMRLMRNEKSGRHSKRGR